MTDLEKKNAKGMHVDTYAHAFEDESDILTPEAKVEAGAGRVVKKFRTVSVEAGGPNISVGAEGNLLKGGVVARGQGLLDVIDNYDRPGDAYSHGLYAGTNTYAHAFEDEPGKRVPKAGAVAEAGVGRAGAEWSIFSAEAKGPNVSAGAEANILSAGAMARAEIGSVSAEAGPVGVKLGLGVDTGASFSLEKTELKLLGTGVTVGSKGVGISLLGSEVNCSVM